MGTCDAETGIDQLSRGVGHFACSRDNCLVTLDSMRACHFAQLGRASVLPIRDASSLGMGTCDAETALD